MVRELPILATWFGAGIAQSFGPCILSRAVALSAVVSGARRPAVIMVAFVLGIILAYEGYLLLGGVMGLIMAYQSVVFAVMAVAMIVGCVLTLRPSHTHNDHAVKHERSLGGALLLGAGTVLQLAPCCTFSALGIVTLSTQTGIGFAALALGAYGLGHAVPLMAVGSGSLGLGKLVRGVAASRWITLVNASLFLYLAAFFAVQV